MTAEAEPSFIGGLPEDRITVTAEHEIAAADPEAEAEGRPSGRTTGTPPTPTHTWTVLRPAWSPSRRPGRDP